MKLVYIAGPYRASIPWEVEKNIFKAREVGVTVAKLGFFPVIPQANTAHFDKIASDTFWLDGTLELMRRCDIVVMVDGWEASKGSCSEREEAKRLGLQVFDSIKDFICYLNELDLHGGKR